jgi:hypothetical protein
MIYLKQMMFTHKQRQRSTRCRKAYKRIYAMEAREKEFED